MPPIVVQELHKMYERVPAVQSLSFVVMPGQILGLLGPNGAGKTTTMRAICGIIPPTHGRIMVAGRPNVVSDPVKAKQQLAYVPDDPHLFDTLTIWEHLQFTASTYRVPRFEPLAEVLLSQFELTEKKNTVAQELSRQGRDLLRPTCIIHGRSCWTSRSPGWTRAAFAR